MEVRVLVSGGSAPVTWDLRCEVREKLIAFLQQDYPQALPRQRAEVSLHDRAPETARRERVGREPVDA